MELKFSVMLFSSLLPIIIKQKHLKLSKEAEVTLVSSQVLVLSR